MTGTDHARTLIEGVKRALRIGVVGIGILASTIIALEICSYLLLTATGKIGHRLRPVPSQYEGKEWFHTMRREEVATNRYLYQPYIVWRRAPYDGETIQIDRFGVRRTTHARCEAESSRVLLFGGSALWGSGSPDWGTIPSQLAKLFQAEGRPMCVINFGESAYVSSQEVIQLVQVLKGGIRPDLVIFYDGWNDISAQYQTGLSGAHANLYDIKQKFEAAPMFLALSSTNTVKIVTSIATGLGLLKPFLERHRQTDENSLPAASASLSIQMQYLRNMEIVEALSRFYGFRYAFFWQPVILAERKSLTAQEADILKESSVHSDLVSLTQSTYQLMREVTARNYFFLGDVFRDRIDSVYVDWVHVDPDSNQFIAARMYELLKYKGYLTTR